MVLSNENVIVGSQSLKLVPIGTPASMMFDSTQAFGDWSAYTLVSIGSAASGTVGVWIKSDIAQPLTVYFEVLSGADAATQSCAKNAIAGWNYFTFSLLGASCPPTFDWTNVTAVQFEVQYSTLPSSLLADYFTIGAGDNIGLNGLGDRFTILQSGSIPSDFMTITDSGSATTILKEYGFDTLTMSDSGSSVNVQVETGSDALTLFENSNYAALDLLPESGSDTMTVFEQVNTPAPAFVLPESGSDNLTMFEQISTPGPIFVVPQSGSDNLTMFEQVNTPPPIFVLQEFGTDNLTLTEIFSFFTAVFTYDSGVDTLTLAENYSFSTFIISAQSGSDNLSMFEQVNTPPPLLIMKKSGADTMTVYDSGSSAHTQIAYGFDALTISELSSYALSVVASGYDNLTLSETSFFGSGTIKAVRVTESLISPQRVIPR